MATDEIFDSAVRSAGDLAGIFEYDGETCYFYLYKTEGAEGQRILDSVHVLSGEPDFAAADVLIRWDPGEQKVGLFIKDVLWAVFDNCRQTSYGGNYRPGSRPAIPLDVEKEFDTPSD